MDEYPNCKCVSVERVDYKPIDLDISIRKMKTAVSNITDVNIYDANIIRIVYIF